MKTDFADILNDCVDRLARGESVEDCLALHPEWAQELTPLLRTTEAALRASMLVPDPARKEEAKRRLQQRAMNEAPPQRNIIVFPRRMRALASMLAAVFLLMLTMVGAIAVSADSIPGDTLYPMKRAAERVQLLMARDDDETSLHLELADRRLSELEAVASRQGFISSSLLSEIAKETEDARDGLDKAERQKKLGERLLSLTSRQQEVLRKVSAEAPEEAREGLSRAIERSAEGHKAASTAIAKNKTYERQGEDEGHRSADTPSGSTAASPTPTNERSSERDKDSRDDDSKGGGDKNKERDRTPTARGGTLRAGDGEDGKRESTSRSSPEATLTRSIFPWKRKLVPNIWSSLSPTSTAGKKNNGSEEK